jgi:Integrase core domain
MIGTLRRELLDRLLIVNEYHLRQVLTEYLRHYNTARPRRAFDQLTPTQADTRPPEPVNLAKHRIRQKQVLQGLTHEYYVAALMPPYRYGTTHVTSRIVFPSPTRPGRATGTPRQRGDARGSRAGRQHRPVRRRRRAAAHQHPGPACCDARSWTRAPPAGLATPTAPGTARLRGPARGARPVARPAGRRPAQHPPPGRRIPGNRAVHPAVRAGRQPQRLPVAMAPRPGLLHCPCGRAITRCAAGMSSGGLDQLRRSAYQVRRQGRTYECYQRRPRGVPTAMQPPGTGIILKLSLSS